MGEPTQDRWRSSAESFYDQRADEKADPERFNEFVKSYRTLAARFPNLKEATVLDAGCGTGILTCAFSGVTKRVVGFDLSCGSLAVAASKNADGRFIQADMTCLPFPDKSFDVALAVTSLEFCENKNRALSEILRALKNDGKFYLEVRNQSFLVFQLPSAGISLLKKSGVLTSYPAEGFRDLAYHEWRKLLTDNGFQIERECASLRPWNYGPAGTRLKNLIIYMVRTFFPIKHHYMIGFYCSKKSKPAEFNDSQTPRMN